MERRVVYCPAINFSEATQIQRVDSPVMRAAGMGLGTGIVGGGMVGLGLKALHAPVKSVLLNSPEILHPLTDAVKSNPTLWETLVHKYDLGHIAKSYMKDPYGSDLVADAMADYSIPILGGVGTGALLMPIVGAASLIHSMYKNHKAKKAARQAAGKLY